MSTSAPVIIKDYDASGATPLNGTATSGEPGDWLDMVRARTRDDVQFIIENGHYKPLIEYIDWDALRHSVHQMFSPNKRASIQSLIDGADTARLLRGLMELYAKKHVYYFTLPLNSEFSDILGTEECMAQLKSNDTISRLEHDVRNVLNLDANDTRLHIHVIFIATTNAQERFLANACLRLCWCEAFDAAANDSDSVNGNADGEWQKIEERAV